MLLNPDERLSGLQGVELTLRSLKTSDSGVYSLVASNAFGVAVGASVSLRVVSPPQVLLAPAHQFAPFLSRVRFGAQIVPPLPADLMGPTLGGLPGEDTAYQWLKDGVAIPGANESVLVLTNVERRDVGFYSLLASNLAGSVQTDPAELQVCQTRHGVVTEGVIATPNRSLLAALESGGSGPGLAGFFTPVVYLSHGVPLFFSASNGASEPGLSICGNPSSRTKWVGYFSPRPDRFRFTTAGSDFDTVLGVYTNRLGKLVEVGCARGVSGPIGAALDLELARNVFYYVAVDGQAGASGVARLAIGGGLLQAPRANVPLDTFQLELVTLAQRSYTVRMSPRPHEPWTRWTPLAIPAYPTDRDWVLPLSVSGLAAFPGRFIAAEER